MIAAAAVVGTLGVLDLAWNTQGLLALLLAGLAVPMTYGAIVWFAYPAAEPAADVPPES
jgi:hypothetical protein